MQLIYQMCSQDAWQEAEKAGCFTGAAIDIDDGFIHFSSAAQVAETARLHFAGQTDLVLVAVDTSSLDIVWEESRGGQLFPHLYGILPMSAVHEVVPMPLQSDGSHALPDALVCA
ncbi:MAG: DUF952 domain-containing protein [Alphaproteobacteria bacterium]